MSLRPKLYFDTDCFHHFATTFADTALSPDLRGDILLSPITMMEALPHIARQWGNQVQRQLRGMGNWLNIHQLGVLPFMDVAVAIVGFGAQITQDDYTARLQADVRACVNADLSTLKQVAEERDQQLRTIKNAYADHFEASLTQLRPFNPNDKDKFTQLWATQFRTERTAALAPRTDAELASTFSALHEFEYEKTKLALQDPDYKPVNHVNDLFDAEQLLYLGDPNLEFLTFDQGYLRKVKNSPQRTRIHHVSPGTFATPESAEAFIRNIIR
jgi:hypothetical protein